MKKIGLSLGTSLLLSERSSSFYCNAAKDSEQDEIKESLQQYYEMDEESTKALGARVVIHHPNETSSPGDQGFNANPCTEISVSLRQSIMYRLPTPFRDHCVDYKRRQGSSVSNQKDCVRTCIQKENFAKCNCIDQTLSVMTNSTHCSFTNHTQMCCLDDVLETLSNYGPFCDCPQPSKTQAPLYDLLKGAKKKDRRKVPWTEGTIKNFEQCKSDLAKAALLSFPKLDCHYLFALMLLILP
ncbi:acid-sensing ion channel 3 [Nephila pilipes]|uniref:Acid-sensing ion channel 3 n=1 Tax=Nephila pilipes TaxID=299642 RepID=A0A8X6QRM3_NEPPI|nr:acid-sensing ion channel 3 [Nephila pilipes]